MFLSTPIISLIYEHGRFGARDTQAAAAALVYYSIGLFAYSAVKLLVPVFYALGHSRIPVLVSAAAVLSNIGLNLILVGPMGYRGLALGTSLTSVFNFLLLFHWLQKYAGSLQPMRIVGSFFKILMASLIMGGVCFCVSQWFASQMINQSLASKVLVLGATIGVGILSLFLSCRILRISEMENVVRILMRRLGSRP